MEEEFKLNETNTYQRIYYHDGKLMCEMWFRNGELHRDNDLPSHIFYDDNNIGYLE